MSPEGNGLVTLRDLTGETDLTLPAIVASPVYWLKEPSAGSPEMYLVSGRVTTAEGAPLAGAIILLEGNPKATTGEDGAFVISGLAPGKYSLQVQLNGSNFDPRQRKVSLPPDVLDADFSSDQSAAASGGSSVENPPIQVTPPAEPVLTLAPGLAGMVQSALEQYGIMYESWMAYAAAIICLAILGLLVIGGVAWYLLRTRRAKPAPLALAPAPVVVKSAPAPLAEPAVSDTQPVQLKPVSAAPAMLEPPVQPGDPVQELLRQGIALVKGTEIEQGRQKLRQVVQLQPENANAWLWLGWAAAQQKDLRAAERCFRRAQSLGHPKAEQGLRWIGKL
jgi:hypothetical protein